MLKDSASNQWTIDDYAFAAEQFGRLNGTCAVHGIRPNVPWITRYHARNWTEDLNFDRAWQHPHVQHVFSARTRTRLERLAEDREQFLTLLERLPQVFSHFDAKRSNLFLRQRPDQHREVVAIDWADCGVGPLGGELVFLVGGSAWFLDWEPTAVTDLSTAAYTAYLEGLAATGWQGDPILIRLGYTAWLSLHFGLVMPAGFEYVMAEENRTSVLRLFGREPDQIMDPWLQMCEYTLSCADEARQLMRHVELP